MTVIDPSAEPDRQCARNFRVQAFMQLFNIQWNLAIVVFKGQAILSHYNKRPLFRNSGLSRFTEIPAQTTKAIYLLPNEVLIFDRILSLALHKLV